MAAGEYKQAPLKSSKRNVYARHRKKVKIEFNPLSPTKEICGNSTEHRNYNLYHGLANFAVLIECKIIAEQHKYNDTCK